jgi:hypothetical protein
MPIQRRLSCSQAIAVVPEPKNGSSMVSAVVSFNIQAPVYVLITKPVCIFNPLAVGLAKPIGSIMAGIIGEAKIQAIVPAGFFHDV